MLMYYSNSKFIIIMQTPTETLQNSWKALLQQIPPVFGNPDAKRVADIMNAEMNGEDVIGLKLHMICEKNAESWKRLGNRLFDLMDTVPYAEWSDSDKAIVATVIQLSVLFRGGGLCNYIN